ncbi:hypothetical protein SFOMI_3136 [Sphingobium fuliginis]|uniref:Uncharacterized protein n=1 Tax=Sphingobium fuliginis (strain ATCC 27551) TaxID=336203 RepID=A0A292ZHL5_SPHSA|nr:hypothetical protein SFOMI_3136 [Sphingobium fuliginis]
MPRRISSSRRKSGEAGAIWDVGTGDGEWGADMPVGSRLRGKGARILAVPENND